MVIKTLDPDPDSLEMQDPDPYPDSMNPDPQLWAEHTVHAMLWNVDPEWFDSGPTFEPSVADSRDVIPDPKFSIPYSGQGQKDSGSRIRIKEFEYF